MFLADLISAVVKIALGYYEFDTGQFLGRLKKERFLTRTDHGSPYGQSFDKKIFGSIGKYLGLSE